MGAHYAWLISLPQNLTIVSQSAGSSAANRFLLAGGPTSCCEDFRKLVVLPNGAEGRHAHRHSANVLDRLTIEFESAFRMVLSFSGGGSTNCYEVRYHTGRVKKRVHSVIGTPDGTTSRHNRFQEASVIFGGL
jgi:hypothetical protein